MAKEVRGVWTTIHTDEDLSRFLQFQETDGKSHDYERELTLPVAQVVSDEGSMAESAMTFTEKTETLKNVYVQSLLNLKAQALANKTDPLATLKVKMSKQWGRKLMDLVINGDSAVNALEFNGLNKMCRVETRMMAMDDGVVDGPGTAETELTQDRLDQMLDTIRPGRANALICNKTMIRKLSQLRRASGSGVLGETEMFGRKVRTYDDIPVVVCDYIGNTDTYADAATWPSSTATTIYAVKFGQENEGFTCIHKGGFMNVEFVDVGKARYTNHEVFRLIGYMSTVVYSPLTIAALGGIDSAS
jgi:hypothetical protein